MDNNKKKLIAYVCSVNPEDKKAWSGSVYKMYESLLREGYEVEWVPIIHGQWEYKTVQFTAKLFYKIFHRKYNVHQDLLISYISGRRLGKKLKKSNALAVFAPACVNDLAFLNTEKPILYFNDANARQLLNYNFALFNIGLLSKKITELIERKTLSNVSHAAFSSEWAANFAKDYYKTPAEKVSVAKLGSNAAVPATYTYDKDLGNEIKFLFLAAAWERKGGDIALDTISELHKRGHEVKLTIVGCVPPIEKLPDFVKVYPFLNRNIPEEKKKIEDILSDHHIMFVPTRSDAYGLVFVEGAAYGMPSVAPHTGGVPAIIDDGKTGILLDFSATPQEYADRIEEIYLTKPEQIKAHGIAARNRYENELNWQMWGEKISKILTGLI